MKFLTKYRSVKIDLLGVTLNDILKKSEDIYQPKEKRDDQLVRVVNENHLIFFVPRDRITPKGVHEFEYFEEKKEILIKSKYKSIFFPGFLYYLIPISSMYFVGTELILQEWKTFFLLILGITIFILFAAITGLISDSKGFERNILIVFKHILRQKGINTKL